jgi:hypothetical protein
MKSIKQQYIDLQEGNMSQANFMRNLRMTMPQYITNLSSFEDSVRILKNKGILTEADEKGKWTNADGKSMYDQFKEIDNLNGQEVLIGIDYEMQKNEELTKQEAQKIVIKNLKKIPNYYTNQDMSGVEGYEPEYIGGKSSNAEARQMQPLEKNMGNIVDKKMGMQPVKNVEKVKKDSDKGGETNKMEKGVSLMSLIAKSTRGVQKMDATGEKMKKVAVKENKVASTIFGKNANITKGVNKIAKEDDKKKSIKDKLKEMIRQEITGAYGGDAMDPEDGSSYINEGKVMDFNEWLNQIAASYPNLVGQDLQDLGVDINTITPEELQDIVTSQGELINYQRGIYKFGKTLNVESGFISFSRGLESYGYYVVSKKEGSITNPKTDWSSRIYPPGSRMD